METVSSGVTAAKGFTAAGIACGMKGSGKKDLALIFSEGPCVCAGLFTKNRVQAAPVKISRGRVERGLAQAIVANSGNANCCTGKRGLNDALRMAKLAAGALGVKEELVLVASTGIIGRPLPIQKIERAIPDLKKRLSTGGSREAAQAIMTTDTKVKEIAVRFELGDKKITIGGIAKGAGMISPDLATLLVFLTTDAAISREALKRSLASSVTESFNRITVDGDMSTNDMLMALANGKAENQKIEYKGYGYAKFSEALEFVCLELAHSIVEDGEGATKFVEVQVEGANSEGDADRVARRLANSPLVKTALFGCDPNWGRIAAAVGSSGVAFGEEDLNIYYGEVQVVKNGSAQPVSKSRLNKLLKGANVKIGVDLKQGKGTARIFTCDLSDKYVRINRGYGRSN